MTGILFKNANLLDGAGPAQSGATVVVEGDRITQVDSTGSIKPGSQD